MLMYLCVCEKAYRFRDMNAMHVVRYVSAIFFFYLFFSIIFWSTIRSPTKPIKNPYQILWLKVLSCVVLRFLRTRSSIEIPQNNSCQSVLRNWCAIHRPMFFSLPLSSSLQTLFESNELLVWGGISFDMTIAATYNYWRPHVQEHLWWWQERNCTDIHSLQIARLCKGARSQYHLFDQYNYGMDVIDRRRFSCFVFILSFFLLFLNKQKTKQQKSKRFAVRVGCPLNTVDYRCWRGECYQRDWRPRPGGGAISWESSQRAVEGLLRHHRRFRDQRPSMHGQTTQKGASRTDAHRYLYFQTSTQSGKALFGILLVFLCEMLLHTSRTVNCRNRNTV